MNIINEENLSIMLSTFVEKNTLKHKEIAKEISCSIATLERIITRKSFPTAKMIKQVQIMLSIGFEKYKKLSAAEKEKISENIGALGGGILGLGSITSAVGAAGTVSGLSAAGISSGLGAIGGVVGGGMTVGILTVAIIPIAVSGIGYSIVKGIKIIIANNKLNKIDIEPQWEYLKR